MKTIKILLILLCIPNLAHAYIDPGSGMLMIQGLIALLGACVAFIKDPIQKIKNFLKRDNKK